jgi:putative effector of murein hydrolase
MIFVVDNFYKLTDNLLSFVGGVNKWSLFIILSAILIFLVVGKILTRKLMISKRVEKARAAGSEEKHASGNARAINEAVESSG